VLNTTASKTLTECTKQLPDLVRFGTTDPNRNSPDRGLSR